MLKNIIRKHQEKRLAAERIEEQLRKALRNSK